MESQVQQADGHSKASRVFIYCTLLVIFLASLVLLIRIWRSHPKQDTLMFEAGKACMQVLSVALVGFLVSYATFTLQRSWERRERRVEDALADQKRAVERALERQERDVEQAREAWRRQVEQAREAWRRQVEQARDARQREDELLHSIFNETLAAYNAVKRARRILRARIWAQAEGRNVDPHVYDEQMSLINDLQLQFEQLKKTAPIIKDKDQRLDHTRLESRFENVEGSLGHLVTEYELKRRDASYDQSGASLSEMGTLQAFLNPGENDLFKAGIAEPVNDILSDLKKALLEPLELSAPAMPEVGH